LLVAVVNDGLTLRSVIVVFTLGLMAWGVLSLLVASIREHFD